MAARGLCSNVTTLPSRAPRSVLTIYKDLNEVGHALSSELSPDIKLWRRRISLIRWPDTEVPRDSNIGEGAFFLYSIVQDPCICYTLNAAMSNEILFADIYLLCLFF